MGWKNEKNGNLPNTNITYPYSQTVTNLVTGEKREFRARTQFELALLLQLDQKQQLLRGQRKMRLAAAQNKQQQVALRNEQLQQIREEFQDIINQAVTIPVPIDWDSQLVKEEFPPFEFKESAPIQKTDYKLGFLKSLFMKEEKFEIPNFATEKLREYEERRNVAIAKYLKLKAEFDFEKDRKNDKVIGYRKRLEESEKEALEQYVSAVLTSSKPPSEFEYEFEVAYDRDKKKIIADFLFTDMDSFPINKSYSYHSETDEIEEVMVHIEEAAAFYSEVLYSIGFRTIQEIFESIYMGGLEIAVFNGYIEDGEESRCVFAMRSTKDNFETIDLKQSLKTKISMIEAKTIGDFTKKDQITPFE